MKLKLGLQIVLFNRAIAIQVFEQKGTPDNDDIYCSLDGFRIASASVPEIHGASTFYVRGDQVQDDWRVTSQVFNSIDDRDNYLKRLYSAFTELAETDNLTIKKQDLGHTIILHLR